MTRAAHKTKLVCTIGPASETPEILQQLLEAGMNIARLNFAHGSPAWHKRAIENLRHAAIVAGVSLTVMGDLPGPKLRIGTLEGEPVIITEGGRFTLTTREMTGNHGRAFVNFPRLPTVVTPGDIIYLNDGAIHLKVIGVAGDDVQCLVLTGGELSSGTGVNLPGIELGCCAFTTHDHEFLKFACENGVDAISQSFVESPADITSVRSAAAELGYHPFIIAKIERAGALGHVDEILMAADGIMVARGDLGVETALEKIALVQKYLISRANRFGKPVITATQMLESMVAHYRPTRAEATDVANAILDGTDCVMLSEESATGMFPVEAVQTLAAIATATEPYRTDVTESIFSEYSRDSDIHLVDLISRSVESMVARVAPAAVIVPTETGNIARMISRFKLPVWVAAVSPDEIICRGLQFSYGVVPVHGAHPADWNSFAREWARSEALPEDFIVMAECPSKKTPHINPHLEVIDLRHAG